MQPKPRRVDLSPDNFIAGVAGQMNATELGVYWMACLLIYSHGGETVCDEKRLAALLPGTHWRTIRAALDRLHELGKLSSRDGHTMAKGCSGPLEEAAKRISRARENGSKGGRPVSENNDLQKPNGLHNEKLPSLSPPPSQPVESISSLRSEISPPENPKRKSRSSLSETFPDDAGKAWAEQKWLAKGRADLCGRMIEIIESFRDHHAGRDTRSADWAGSWRTWAKNEMNFSKAHKNGNGQAAGERRLSPHEKFARAGLSIILDAERSAAGDGDHDNAGEAQRPLLET